MKNKYFIFACIFILLATWIFYSLPKSYEREIEGIYYRLGDTKGEETKTTNIRFQGYYTKRLFKMDKFQGTIYIDDKKLDGVTLDFKEKKYFPFEYFDESSGEFEHIGRIYTNGNLNEFTISVAKRESVGHYSWNGRDGYIISAPCKSREEALKISSELMKEYLQGYKLK